MLPTAQLSDELTGRVIGSGDPDYDDARAIFSGAFDLQPALIARPADADDVARVVGFARETGLELAVRSGGHSGAGHGSTDGGIMLDLSDMRALDIDAEYRSAWAETGLTAGAYTKAAARHGLATGFGDTASVGIGGITLGGGVGYLVRSHGLTIDDLLAAEIVTADGELLRVDAEHHPDLFWAIRGGGGNFGVVTRMRFRLHAVDRVVGGMLVLPAEPDVIAGFVAAAEDAPEELSAIANVMPAPPMPFLAPEQHGRLVLLATMVYAGDAEAGQRALAPFRALAAPVADLLRPMAYPEIYPPEQEDFRPVAAIRTLFVDRVGVPEAEAMVEHVARASAPMAATQIRVLGGAMARVPADATAFAHRRSPIMLNVAAMFPRPEDQPIHQAWVDGLADELRQDDPGAYVGFLADDGEAAVRAAYPGATWDRLAAVKAAYDPDNLFRRNHNVPPAA